MEDQGTTSPRRIRRDTTEGIIGGVAAGFARHLEVDVVWVRLAFVLTTVFASGLGLIAYIAARIIIPAGEDRDAGIARRTTTSAGAGTSASQHAPDGVRSARFWVGVGLIGLGGLVLLQRLLQPLQDRFGWIAPGRLLVPLALIAVGTLLWRASRSDTPTVLASSTQDLRRWGERVGEETEVAAARLEQWVDDGGALPDTPDGAPDGASHGASDGAPDVSAERPPSRVTPATLGVALVAGGSVALLSGLGVDGATLARALAIGLLVIGIGLVIGAFIGRGGGLMGTGFVLAPLVLVTTLAGPTYDEMRSIVVGEDGITATDPDAGVDAGVEERPLDLASVRDTYTFGVGRITLDLSAIDTAELIAAGTTRITVELGVGDLRVILPDDVTIIANVELGIGQIELSGRTSGGLGVDATQTFEGPMSDTVVIVVDIQQGIGRVRVDR